MAEKWVSYLRVSTGKQGRSGLGLEAQRAAVLDFLQNGGKLVKEFVEVESGKTDERPQLQAPSLPASSMGPSWLSPRSTAYPVMPISCSGWKRRVSILWPPICLPRTG
jgi:hypothetical protein